MERNSNESGALIPGPHVIRLLVFLTRLPHQNIAKMGTEISEAAMIAMRRILNERLGTLDRSKMKTSFALSRETLALFVRWCLLVRRSSACGASTARAVLTA